MSINQMTSRTLNALKGWPSPHAVDFEAKMSAAALALLDPVPEGTVVHLDSSGEFALGVGNDAVMPMFLFTRSDDPDGTNKYAGDPSTDKGVMVAISPTGALMALVAAGAYELTSTNFVSASYAPNAHLTAAKTGGNAGKLVAGTLYTNTICGVVSRGVQDNGYGTNTLAFWPVYIPPTS